MRLFFIIILLYSTAIFAQEFYLTNLNYGTAVSVDYFSGDIYFAPGIRSDVDKYCFTDNSIEGTEFKGLPEFMQKTHKAVCMEITDSSNIYTLYDFFSTRWELLFEKVYLTPLLKETNYNEPYFTISPNDNQIFLRSVFVISDSTWIYPSGDLIMFGERWPSY